MGTRDFFHAQIVGILYNKIPLSVKPIFLCLLSEFKMHGRRIALSKMVDSSELK